MQRHHCFSALGDFGESCMHQDTVHLPSSVKSWVSRVPCQTFLQAIYLVYPAFPYIYFVQHWLLHVTCILSSVKFIIMPEGHVQNMTCSLKQSFLELRNHFASELNQSPQMILMLFDGKCHLYCWWSLICNTIIMLKAPTPSFFSLCCFCGCCYCCFLGMRS